MFSSYTNVTKRLSLAPTFSFFSTSVAVSADVQEDPVDLITFLSVVEKYRVPYLPLTWSVALDALGSGATGLVSQSTPNLAMTFAFKRIRDSGDLECCLLPLITEVAILSQSPIKEHPNIINLEGICWEVKHHLDEVLPVLVFEKATCDLDQFLKSEEGINISLCERLQICADIGTGILALHTYGVIHGDIKPQNVLVFSNPERTVVKISDFGYSTMIAGECGRVRLPKSRPWNAPEHHFGNFTVTEAKKTDVYSFGLLCIWILFGEMPPMDSTIKPTASKELISFSLPPEPYATLAIEQLKDQDTLLITVHKLLHKTPGFEEVVACLEQFFNLVLVRNPASRTADFGELLPLLRRQEFPPVAMVSFLENIIYSADSEFRLATNLIEFLPADYPVRKHIRLCLEQKYGRTKSCNLAFQVAFCYKIGFGVKSDETLSDTWLKRSNRLVADIEDEKTAVVAKKLSSNKRLDSLLKDSLIAEINLLVEYKVLGRQKLNEACEQYRRELNDMEEQFGEEHIIISVCALREKIIHLLVELAEFSEAKALSLKTLKINEKVFGQVNLKTLISIANAGLIYWEEGRPEKAEKVEVRAMQMMIEVFGQRHPQTLNIMANLAITYKTQCKYDEAQLLAVKVMEMRKKVLGEEHPDTLSSIVVLASIYHHQNQWKKAEEVQVKAVKIQTHLLGPAHPNTLNSIQHLALTYREQGRWSEAEELQIKVTETTKRVLGLEHPDTLISFGQLALTYREQGRWSEVEDLQVQQIEMGEKVYGLKHPRVVVWLGNLASTYWAQGKWSEAEELQLLIMERMKKVFGQSHPNTIASISNLALTYSEQGRWTEAEGLLVSVMEMSKQVFSREHLQTARSIANLASIYWKQIRLTEAEELQRQSIMILKKVVGLENQETLANMSSLARIYIDQERFTEAEELEVQVMKKMTKILGWEHPQTLHSMKNSALIYHSQKRWTEAEELQVKALETGKKVLGREHPSTLYTASDLASTYSKQGRWAEAEELQVWLMEITKKKFGGDHPDTLRNMSNLAFTYKSQDRMGDAIALMRLVLTFQSPKLGEEYPHTKCSRNALAEWMKESKNTESFI